MLWLSAVPCGLWSEAVATPSMDENRVWIRQLATVLQAAIEHFGLALRGGTSIDDLAGAASGLIEGLWLNQCLTTRHPLDDAEPISTVLQRSGRLLWRGATTSPA